MYSLHWRSPSSLIPFFFFSFFLFSLVSRDPGGKETQEPLKDQDSLPPPNFSHIGEISVLAEYVAVHGSQSALADLVVRFLSTYADLPDHST
jgi:hypothetical protein